MKVGASARLSDSIAGKILFGLATDALLACFHVISSAAWTCVFDVALESLGLNRTCSFQSAPNFAITCVFVLCCH